MRELTDIEISFVNGGNPLLSGAGGAFLGGVEAYGSGGDFGDVVAGATFGFATGTFGAIAWAARSVYYGAVTVGMAFAAGMASADDS